MFGWLEGGPPFCASEGEIGCDTRGKLLAGNPHEVVQAVADFHHLEAERSPESDVIVHRLRQRRHGRHSGHRGATVRNARRSTLAYSAVVSGCRCRRISATSANDPPPRSRVVASVNRRRWAPRVGGWSPVRANARLPMVETAS